MTQIKDKNSINLLGKGPAVCSGKVTATGAVYTGKVAITSIILMTDGANDATIVVANGNGGTTLREFTVTSTENFGGNAVNYPIYADTGIYVTLTGTGAFCFIDYIEL